MAFPGDALTSIATHRFGDTIGEDENRKAREVRTGCIGGLDANPGEGRLEVQAQGIARAAGVDADKLNEFGEFNIATRGASVAGGRTALKVLTDFRDAAVEEGTTRQIARPRLTEALETLKMPTAVTGTSATEGVADAAHAEVAGLAIAVLPTLVIKVGRSVVVVAFFLGVGAGGDFAATQTQGQGEHKAQERFSEGEHRPKLQRLGLAEARHHLADRRRSVVRVATARRRRSPGVDASVNAPHGRRRRRLARPQARELCGRALFTASFALKREGGEIHLALCLNKH